MLVLEFSDFAFGNDKRFVLFLVFGQHRDKLVFQLGASGLELLELSLKGLDFDSQLVLSLAAFG